jgi:hypothetical protein
VRDEDSIQNDTAQFKKEVNNVTMQKADYLKTAQHAEQVGRIEEASKRGKDLQ